MSESNPNPNLEPREEQQPSYTPASFEKRTAAWMGVAYMVMLVLIMTFSIATGGQPLTGTFPLLLVPVAAAGLVILVHRRKTGAAGLPITLAMGLICICAMGLGLLLGVPALIHVLQNPFGV